jgi:hypothetical protein
VNEVRARRCMTKENPTKKKKAYYLLWFVDINWLLFETIAPTYAHTPLAKRGGR